LYVTKKEADDAVNNMNSKNKKDLEDKLENRFGKVVKKVGK